MADEDRKWAKIEMKRIRSLLLLLQNKMQTLGVNLPPRRRRKLDRGLFTSCLIFHSLLVSWTLNACWWFAADEALLNESFEAGKEALLQSILSKTGQSIFTPRCCHRSDCVLWFYWLYFDWFQTPSWMESPEVVSCCRSSTSSFRTSASGAPSNSSTSCYVRAIFAKLWRWVSRMTPRGHHYCRSCSRCVRERLPSYVNSLDWVEIYWFVG